MFIILLVAILGFLVFSVSSHNLRIVLGARLFSDMEEVCTSFIKNLYLKKKIKWVRLDKGFRNVLQRKRLYLTCLSDKTQQQQNISKYHKQTLDNVESLTTLDFVIIKSLYIFSLFNPTAAWSIRQLFDKSGSRLIWLWWLPDPSGSHLFSILRWPDQSGSRLIFKFSDILSLCL